MANVVVDSLADGGEDSSSGISWAAVAAGAFVVAALSFALMALGAGMGLSSISPWPTSGLSASRIAPLAIVWIILVQAISCALGGYLAGRLRTRWVTLHTHEVYFRDTAHGFLVWAVGLVISVFFLSSVVLSIANEKSGARVEGRNDYYADSLLRSGRPIGDRADASLRGEVKEILEMAIVTPAVRKEDRAYLADVVASKTGLSRTDAEARVDETVRSYRQAVDTARKAVAHSLYWLFAALLIGAFCGSFSATIGGSQRDRVPAMFVSPNPARRT